MIRGPPSPPPDLFCSPRQPGPQASNAQWGAFLFICLFVFVFLIFLFFLCLFKKNYIYFWLHWTFIAVVGLSLVAESGLPVATAPLVAVCGLCIPGSAVKARRL